MGNCVKHQLSMCRLNGVSDLVLMAIVVLPLFNSFAIIVGTILLIEHLSTGQKALTTRKGRGLALCRQNPYCRRHDNRQAPSAPPGLPLLRHRPTTTQTRCPRPGPEVLLGEMPAGRSEPPAQASASARAAVLNAGRTGDVVTMTTIYVHMRPLSHSDGCREITLRKSRTDRENYDLDVDTGSQTALTLFSLTAGDVLELEKGCRAVLAELREDDGEQLLDDVHPVEIVAAER
jgi:hypothetical protein